MCSLHRVPRTVTYTVYLFSVPNTAFDFIVAAVLALIITTYFLRYIFIYRIVVELCVLNLKAMLLFAFKLS